MRQAYRLVVRTFQKGIAVRNSFICIREDQDDRDVLQLFVFFKNIKKCKYFKKFVELF
ncbi:hypothetical protein HNR39_001131 [Glaciimonas immobilis]|uniref:Uncharacterized protein n=1 Tax=Glaciimonas immobilis TaxID=728004 RepID=A0A840RRG1_9BURK|nr:hypothetical protein [Glaciimonas immobilis]